MSRNLRKPKYIQCSEFLEDKGRTCDKWILDDIGSTKCYLHGTTLIDSNESASSESSADSSDEAFIRSDDEPITYEDQSHNSEGSTSEDTDPESVSESCAARVVIDLTSSNSDAVDSDYSADEAGEASNSDYSDDASSSEASAGSDRSDDDSSWEENTRKNVRRRLVFDSDDDEPSPKRARRQ